MTESLQPQDPEERRAIARDAQSLIDNLAFQQAIEDMKKDIVNELSAGKLEQNATLLLAARLQVISDFKSLLPYYVNKQKHAKR